MSSITNGIHCAGVYESDGTTKVLSRGLGSADEKLSRRKNPPDDVVVKIGGY